MAKFNVYLKDKDGIVIVEADEADIDNLHLTFKQGKEIVAQFRNAEVQGYRREQSAPKKG
ncbi:MAG: hypothetical protein LAP87_20880 [Acidobacteriia bacterium]|nr:hypothetical protein [Terriglobia bacterium]